MKKEFLSLFIAGVLLLSTCSIVWAAQLPGGEMVSGSTEQSDEAPGAGE